MKYPKKVTSPSNRFLPAIAVILWMGFGSGSLLSQSITSVGAVTALTDINQMKGNLFTADFNGGSSFGLIDLDRYADQGMTLHSGLLAEALPGVITPGGMSSPYYTNTSVYFPEPILGGGSSNGTAIRYQRVATFDISISQFGLTASRNGSQFLTAWDRSGNMLGQVN